MEIASRWSQVSDWIQSAVEINQGDENLVDVLVALAQGRYLLWHEPDKFAAVVQVQQFPRQTVAVVLYAGGDLDAFRERWEEGKAWCRQHGIAAIRTFGRGGWERVLGMQKIGAILQVNV